MIISLFIMGIVSSLHCLGMCGPIVFALPIRKNNIAGIFQNFIYQLGRVTTYGFLGLIFGLLGSGLKLAGLQQSLSIIIGIIMIISVLIPQSKIKKYSSKPISIFFGRIKVAFKYLFQKKTFSSFFIIGLLNGFLPCGVVYMALLIALESGNYFLGIINMIAFGLGTIPLMFFAVWFVKIISIELREKILKFIPIFVFIIGGLFIVRGLGIRVPFLAPSQEYLQLKERK